MHMTFDLSNSGLEAEYSNMLATLMYSTTL